MNKIITDLLIGVLLGDAHIGRTGENKAFISFEQSKKKLDYLNFLYKLCQDGGLDLTEMKTYSRTDLRYPDNITESLYFRTKSLEKLKFLADMFLNKDNKKVVPLNIADYLNPRSLVFWIMDDGQQVKNGGVTLCTDSFNSLEINILRDALSTNFNIVSTIHKKKSSSQSYFDRIYIQKKSLIQIKLLLKEHFHESMLYKINET